MSVCYFGNIGYFAHLLNASEVIADVYETYPKQTWRNRCMLYSANGPLAVSIPVSKPHGNNTKTRDVLISDHSNWQKNHWSCIQSAYNNAPYFLYYQDLLKPVFFGKNHNNLADLDVFITASICDELGITTPFSISDKFITDTKNAEDLRFIISPKVRIPESQLKEIFPTYYQVFFEKYGFIPNLSILDLLFNKGPETLDYLKKVNL